MVKSWINRLLNTILDSVMGSGLFCGFITASTVGLGYFFVVVRASFFQKDIQKRVAAMTGFLMGQFVMFTSIYDRPLYRVLVQPHSIIMLFLSSFFVQLVWTNLKTLRNTEFLHPEDAIIKRKRVLSLQLEFILNFFVQLCNRYLQPDSMVPRLVNFFLSYNKEKKVLFVMYSFIGWLIGHVFFLILVRKLLKFIIDWLRNNFFQS